jgi:protein disulfide-isomerase A1
MTPEDIPLLVAIMPANMKKYYCDTKPRNLTVEIIGKFMNDVLEGKLEPSYKSEEIPEKNYGPLTIVVGKEFEKLV